MQREREQRKVITEQYTHKHALGKYTSNYAVDVKPCDVHVQGAPKK